MINIISAMITWLKGYRKISPPKHTPDIPDKFRDEYINSSLEDTVDTETEEVWMLTTFFIVYISVHVAMFIIHTIKII